MIMGYYSSFEMIHGEEFEAEFKQVCGNADYSLGEDADISKWYDCSEDIALFSKNHPDVIFCIERKGEECLDIERIYALNGKTYSDTPKIIWNEKEKILLYLTKGETK